MISKVRKIVVLNLFREGPILNDAIEFGGLKFNLMEHRIGWDFETAERLIQKYDGYVDGIALSGVQKRATVGKLRWMNPAYLTLMRAAVKTPVYLADDVRDFFADWTLRKILKEQPQLFLGKKVLFQCAIISPYLKTIAEAGGRVFGADPLLVAGVPVLLRGVSQIQAFLGVVQALNRTKLGAMDPEGNIQKRRVRERFNEWVRESHIVVSFLNLLERMESLDALKGKILVVDALTDQARERLEKAGVAQVIEFVPDHPAISQLREKHFSVITALVDQKRLAEDSPLGFDEYTLKWLQEAQVRPSSLRSTRGIVRKCAFIIHPLSQSDIWKTPGLSFMSKASKNVRGFVEQAAALAPAFYYGRLKGVTSRSTGQELVCDIYALPATPKQLLAANEEFIYGRMIDCAAMAKKRGAALIGLGAYTKVIGDAGLTVSRRAPIPVTNGNSYSASTTLWAARVMIEKMGLIPPAKNGTRHRGRAMVIGATGSIGRVSALLVSLVVDDLVLVATRPDKLMELREEILELSPEVRVRVTTNPNPDLPGTDLVVTATSNQSGAILDIEAVKPGAVICDCSRPLDISAEDAAKRPDVLIIESGEVLLPGELDINVDIGLPKPAVYACLAETVLLTLEGRFESFSVSKQLSMEKVKEIYRIGVKHGAELSAIQGPNGVITDEQVQACRALAVERLKSWEPTKVRGEE